MELCHTHAVGSGYARGPVYQSRVLTSTSGNAQNRALETKNHLEFRKPALRCNRATSEPQYPVPAVLLSNDKDGSDARLTAYKSPKYKSYRQRKRFDCGKDGKPVWPDHIEDAFQNALVHIPPMGRHKKTQHGKAQGRNELVSEWIRQETGEERDRKQVSSHIQVLNGLLKDNPDWRALTISNGTHNDGNDFYFESIADQVRLQRQLTAEAKMQMSDGQSWCDLLSQGYNLSNLKFDMWVGLPDDMNKALHNYTHLQSDQSRRPSVPLENLKNWRGLFPDLEKILGSSTQEDYNIIGIKSRLSLMPDFPPTTSKLGLILSLDFRSLGRENLQALGDFNVWSCVNHMYSNGQRFSMREHTQGRTCELGVVNLAFEADWWATQFTRLTHKRKGAENNNDDSAIASAEEDSKELFRGLTMMQEVYASPYAEGPRKRMAILLWVFSQASKGHTGVTSWQKLMAPPDRLTTNSPTPDRIESSLPPLIMDSMMDTSFDTDMTDNEFSHEVIHHVPLSPTIYETNTYHSGLTPLQTMSSDPLRLFDFNTSTGFTPTASTLAENKCEAFDFAAPLQSIPSFSSSQQMLVSQDPNITTHHPQLNRAYHVGAPLPMSSPEPGRRRSLANFDMSTHQMLQAQLGPDTNDLQRFGADITMSVPAVSHSSMVGHMNDLELEEEQMSQAMIAAAASQLEADEDDLMHEKAIVDHPTVFESPKVTRPPLIAHNSFAGVLHSRIHTEETEQLAFDTPARNDFARLISNHFEQPSPNDLFDNLMYFPQDFSRPRSQPVLPSNEDSLGFDVTPMQSTTISPEISVGQS